MIYGYIFIEPGHFNNTSRFQISKHPVGEHHQFETARMQRHSLLTRTHLDCSIFMKTVNLASHQLRQDPFGLFEQLRREGPLARVKLAVFGKMWMTTTYKGANDLLRDHKTFVRDPANAGKKFLSVLQLMLPRSLKLMSKNMLAVDEPDHRRLRSLVVKAFVKTNIDSLRPRLVELANQQLDIAEQQAKSAGNQVDLLENFARPFPLTVICELLGLPESDRVQFKKWFRAFTEVSSAIDLFRIIPGLKKCMKYFQEQFAQVRKSPRDGLLTALVQAEESGDRLNDEELLAMAMLLLLAGHETTVHLISTAFLSLFQFPEQRANLQHDPTILEPFVEEVLRHGSAIQFTKPRIAAIDTEFHGIPLKRGTLITAGLAAGNYDPAAFDQPQEFRLNRQNKAITFGLGPHVCLGAKLARAETEIAIEQALLRWPELAANFDPLNPDWSKRIGFRSLKTMNVKPVGACQC